MLKRKLKKFKLKKFSLEKDAECNTYPIYGVAQEDTAVIWPAGGKVQAEMYGLKLGYMLNMNYYGALDIAVNDGVCIESNEPDYKVIAIKEYTKFKFIELERIR